MDVRRAYLILDAQPSDSPETIKRKYHQMIQLYHPDTVGEDEGSIYLAQQINEAYALLKSLTGENGAGHRRRSEAYRHGTGRSAEDAGAAAWHGADRSRSAEDRDMAGQRTAGSAAHGWKAGVNAQAYCPRIVYAGSGTYDSGQNLWHQTGREKYNWDPDQEDFRIFLYSVNEACSELLGEVERSFFFYNRDDLPEPVLQDEARLQLFHLLTQQFIQPAFCLERIAQEHERDPEQLGKFCFEAAVGVQGAANIQLLEHIRPGDMLDLETVGERIVVKTREGLALGHLSFHEDSLYYVTSLLLQEQGALMEAQVKRIQQNRTVRPYRARVALALHILLKETSLSRQMQPINAQIDQVLDNYRRALQQMV